MRNSEESSDKKTVRRIGIIFADLGKLNIPALKYLVLHLNTFQQSFEYEFLPTDDNDEFLQNLSYKREAYRKEIEDGVEPFLKRYKAFLEEEIKDYDIKDTAIPNYIILITMARFGDRYYSTRKSGLSILALGNWQRTMAPPSIIEFILTLVVRESIGIVCPSLDDSVHLGTKGCICDFTAYLPDARVKILSGFVCHYCNSVLESHGFGKLVDDLVLILRKEWLGKSNDPSSPAGIATNLGYDLFITKGLTTTTRERIRNLLTEEVLKQFIATTAAVITSLVIAFLLIRFGLNPR